MARDWLRFGFLAALLINIIGISLQSKAEASERTLHIGYPLEPTGVNFLLFSGTWNHVLYRDLNEHLVRFNRSKGRIEPGQAEAWRYDAQTQQYWFTLRQGLRWSDGTTISAQDYVRSWRYYADPEEKSRCKNVLKSVQNFSEIKAKQLPAEELGVTAIDDVTLRVTLAQPNRLFLRFLSNSNCFLLPFQRVGHLDFSKEWKSSKAVVYNGPYRLARDIVPGQPVVLIRNPTYWNQEKLFFEKVVWHSYLEKSNLLIQDLLAGRIHIAYKMKGTSNVSWMLEHRPNWVKNRHQSGALEFLSVHKERSSISRSLSLRSALSMVIDREALVKALPTGQKGKAAYSMAPSHYYHEPPLIPKWQNWSMFKRRQKARVLLADSGYSPSNPLKLTLRMTVENKRRQLANALSAMWQTVGIETETILSDSSEHYKAIRRGDFDLARVLWQDQTGSPRYFFRLLNPKSPLLNHSLKIPKWPESLNSHHQSEAQQEQLYREIEAQNQAYAAAIPLFHIEDISFVSPRLQGYNGEAWWLRDLQALRWRDGMAPAP